MLQKSSLKLLISILVILSGCTPKKASPTYSFELTKSAELTTVDFDFDCYPPRAIRFDPLYIGKDTSHIAYQAVNDYNYYHSLDSFLTYFNDDSRKFSVHFDSFSIIVDTTQILQYYGFAPYPEPVHPDSSGDNYAKRYQQILDSIKVPFGFPIIIRNNSDKCQVIGSFGNPSILVESFDGEDWNLIRHPQKGCGFNPVLFLPPDHICITTFPLFENLRGQKIRLSIKGEPTRSCTFRIPKTNAGLVVDSQFNLVD